jgi:hypothetical protein
MSEFDQSRLVSELLRGSRIGGDFKHALDFAFVSAADDSAGFIFLLNIVDKSESDRRFSRSTHRDVADGNHARFDLVHFEQCAVVHPIAESRDSLIHEAGGKQDRSQTKHSSIFPMPLLRARLRLWSPTGLWLSPTLRSFPSVNWAG